MEDGKVLLDKSGDDLFWKFCGGKVKEEDADLQATAKRRSREELGIEIEIINPEPFLMHTLKETPEGNIDVFLVHYLAKRLGEINPGADIREWKWIALADLNKEELAPNITPTLKHFNFI